MRDDGSDNADVPSDEERTIGDLVSLVTQGQLLAQMVADALQFRATDYRIDEASIAVAGIAALLKEGVERAFAALDPVRASAPSDHPDEEQGRVVLSIDRERDDVRGR